MFQSDGTFIDYNAGSFVYHPEHNHTHFDDYAEYRIDSLTAPGSSQRSGTKTTFCIIDTTSVNPALPGAPILPFYTTCGTAEQGLSVGWGDTYPYYLAGQSIDVTGLPGGDYTLTVEVDPKGRLIESNEGDNTNTIVVRLLDGTVSVVPSTPTPTPTPTNTPTPTATRTPTPCPMAEDIDGNGVVGFYDLLQLARAYNTIPSDPRWNSLADFNGSNSVDFDDLLMLAARYTVQCVP